MRTRSSRGSVVKSFSIPASIPRLRRRAGVFDMQPMANIALRAVRQAGQILLRAMDRLDALQIEEKGRNDFVSNVDREAEKAIIDALHKAYPEHGIVGEEHGEAYTGSRSGSGTEFTWIIDPLDGTTNYLHGIP